MGVAAAAAGDDPDGRRAGAAAADGRRRLGLPVGATRQRCVARGVGRHLPRPRRTRAGPSRSSSSSTTRTPRGPGAALRRRGRGAARGAAVRRLDRARVLPLLLRRLLGEPRRWPGRWSSPPPSPLAGDHVLGHPRAAPHRGQHPAREHREPGRRAQARVPRARGCGRTTSTSPATGGTTCRSRSPQRTSPARRCMERLVRGPHVDVTLEAGSVSRRPSRTQSSQQSLARHTERGPASDGDAHLPS